MRIRFSPSGTAPGFLIEAEDENDSALLEMVSNFQNDGYNLQIGGSTLASGARIRYPDIKLSMVKVR